MVAAGWWPLMQRYALIVPYLAANANTERCVEIEQCGHESLLTEGPAIDHEILTTSS